MDEQLEDYILAHIDAEPDNLYRLYRDTNLQLLYSRMCSGHLQGRLLKMLVQMIRPRLVLELGTYSGYATLCLAEGLDSDTAHVHTIELDDELEDFIREHFAQSPFGHRITLHIGDVKDVLPTIEGEFDLIYIDANKRDYTAYYQAVLPRLRKGGFIIADNTLWDGKVAHELHKMDAQTQGIMDFNDAVAQDCSVEKVIIPLRDGLTLIRKK
ncbi:MAG: O-methyltransferase [Muribaculaceae bacterium]|nr:O-methyltransferase [Muribaculaceae bacterium]